MRLFQWSKDGGPDSPVDGFFIIEIKYLFSIALLKFNKGNREAYHNHAFDALTWLICGRMVEQDANGDLYVYRRSLLPKVTKRNKMHRVFAFGNSWCLTIRGPWSNTWMEYDEKHDKTTCFTWGRNKVWEVRGRHY